jgi:hypothetical protein
VDASGMLFWVGGAVLAVVIIAILVWVAMSSRRG